MIRQRHRTEKIIKKLREAEEILARGKSGEAAAGLNGESLARGLPPLLRGADEAESISQQKRESESLDFKVTAFLRRCMKYIMTRTQIQFPEPLHPRLKEIAERQDWSLSEVMRRAAKHFVTRFPKSSQPRRTGVFPPFTTAEISLSIRLKILRQIHPR